MTMIQAFNDYCKKEGIRANGQYALEDVMPHFEAGYKALLAELSKDAEPTVFMYQHDETGRTTFRNPDERMNERRWEEFPLYTHPAIDNTAEKDAEISHLRMALADTEALEMGTSEKVISQQAHIESLREALEEIANWLVCAPIASAIDMAQSFPHMYSVAEKSLSIQSSADALREHDAKLVEKIAQTRTTAEYWKTEHIAGNQLIAEQQAHIEVIRDALEFLNARIVTMDLGGVVEKALAIQSSTDALREHDAQLVERIADRNLTAGTRIFLAEIAEKIRKGEF